MNPWLPSLAITLFWVGAAQANPKIEKQLDAVFGPGKSKVTQTEKIKPGSMIRKKSHSNPQVLAEQKTTYTNGQVTRTESKPQYLYNTTEELTQKAPRIEEGSLSVIYEGDMPPSEVRAMIQNQVKDPVQLHVQKVRFDNSIYLALKAEMEKAKQSETPWGFLAAGLLGGGAFGGGVVFMLLRRKLKQTSQPIPYSYAQTYVTIEPDPST